RGGEHFAQPLGEDGQSAGWDVPVHAVAFRTRDEESSVRAFSAIPLPWTVSSLESHRQPPHQHCLET
ncbi:MAG: hypothetical protein OSA98_24430, partial [Rubripirellula sp.]|nr:hypothetical protein [Rubripirellula sp.]